MYAINSRQPMARDHGIRSLGVICVAVLVVILTLGLWPFQVPTNDVTWLGDHNGLHFGRYGTVLSSGVIAATHTGNGEPASLEIWLQPRRIWDNQTFLAFYAPEDPFRFSLHQLRTDLALQTAMQGNLYPTKPVTLLAFNVFHKRAPVFLTITSGPEGTAIYADGVPAGKTRQVRVYSTDFTGRLIVGDSPRQGNSWSGELLGLAIYRRELSVREVHEHYDTWTKRGRLEIHGDEFNVALYLFDERKGNVIHNRAGSAVNLYISSKYSVVDKIFLESPWSEFRRPGDFWGAVLKNVVGFIPFGWCFYAYLSTARPVNRAALATVILGTLVSITIEILQAYLPTRASGTTDIVTNTLGTYVGVVMCKVASPILAAKLPWLPLVAVARRCTSP
jgi:VanZ family protein